MCFSFIEDVVFRNTPLYNSSFVQALKMSKKPDELLVYGNIGEAWSSVKTVLEHELRAKAASAATDEGGDGGDGRKAPTHAPCQEKDGATTVADDTLRSDEAQDSQPEVWWRRFAQDTVKSRVLLRPIPNTDDHFVTELNGSAAGKTAGRIMVHYDPKLAAEANSRPSSRKAPLREVHLKTCMQAAQKVFDPTQARVIKPGVYFVFHDQGRRMENILTGQFKAGPADKALAPSVQFRKFAVVRDQALSACRSSDDKT